MKKKWLGILCVLSGLTAAVLAGILCRAAAEWMRGICIIGGADWPALRFWLRVHLAKDPAFYCLLTAVAVFIATLILLRKRKGTSKN